MRILFTSNLSGLGGGEISILHIIKKLITRHEIFLLCPQEGTLASAAREIGVTVIVDNFKRKNIFMTFYKFNRLGDFDIVHSNECSAALLFGAFNTLRKNKFKNYWTCHGQWYVFSKIKAHFIGELTTGIFCVSNNVYKNLKKYGIEKLTLSYLGVDFSKEIISSGKKIREELELKEDAVLITTVARYEKVKGQYKAIEALEPILLQDSNIHYVLVGGSVFGNEEDINYYNRVIERVNKSPCKKQIHILGERRDIDEIMQNVDLLLVPSDRESLSMVTIEAIKNNLMVITTPCEGPEEILENNEALICTENSSIGIRKKIYEFLYEENIKQDMLIQYEEIEKHVKSRFSIDKVTKIYEDIFND